MPNEPIIYERSVLYEEIWAEPMRTVAARHGVSDVALAKTCRRLAVPVPGRGYWAKHKAGKAPERPPLPPLPEGTPDRHVGYAYHSPPEEEPLEGLDAAATLELPAPIVVPDELTQPHKLVAISARYLRKAEPVNEVVYARRTSCLDIVVSPAALERALRIMDALLKAMEEAGLNVEVAAVGEVPEAPRYRYSYGYGYERADPEPRPPERVTRVLCDEEWIELQLSERIRRLRDAGPPLPDGSRPRDIAYNCEPTGELILELTNVNSPGVRTKWKESKKRRLEDMLGEFVACLPTVALSFKLEREAEERRKAEAREAEIRRYREQQQRWEEEERQREEERREQAFEAEAAQWHRAQAIREYVEAALTALERRRLTEEDEDEREERKRLAWALELAERIDPLAPSQREAHGAE